MLSLGSWYARTAVAGSAIAGRGHLLSLAATVCVGQRSAVESWPTAFSPQLNKPRLQHALVSHLLRSAAGQKSQPRCTAFGCALCIPQDVSVLQAAELNGDATAWHEARHMDSE